MIDRVAQKISRRLYEVPVGFKWFAPGLFDGSVGFGGEESAGASFTCGWTTPRGRLTRTSTDRGLARRKITAVTGKDPSEHYRELTDEFGIPFYTRIDATATPEQKDAPRKLSPDAVKGIKDSPGDPITCQIDAGTRQ